MKRGCRGSISAVGQELDADIVPRLAAISSQSACIVSVHNSTREHIQSECYMLNNDKDISIKNVLSVEHKGMLR